MQVMINGKEALIQEPVSIAGIIAQRQINPEAVVVEHNGSIIKCCDWQKTLIKEKDILEIVSFVGGG